MYCKSCGNELGSGSKFCRDCGLQVLMYQSIRKKIPWARRYDSALIAIAALFVGGIFLMIVTPDDQALDRSYSTLIEELLSARSDRPASSFIGKGFSAKQMLSKKDSIPSAVVNIICQDNASGGSGGSGTIIDPGGLVLTNNHIIPENDEGEPTINSCIITLPNPQTGKVDQMYTAKPLPLPGISGDYDLAFFSIKGPYVDENGKSYGVKTDTYPAFEGCENNNPILGQKIRLYGYPEISAGGWYLTVTEGVVSAIPNDGTIITSAKVSHGNSGGLAVDENGCIIGVPSRISSDKSESLGVIISNKIVNLFIDDFGSVLDEMSKTKQ